MLGILATTTVALIVLGLLFATMLAAVLAFESEQGLALLRRQAWFRQLELLPPPELRYRGLVSLGVGLCSFAAILTLKLLVPEFGIWAGLALGVMSVVAITMGAALLERAAHLDERDR
jgi:hypothetical protein